MNYFVIKTDFFCRIPCNLRQFLANYVLNVFLKRKTNEIMEQIDAAIRAADAWKATVLLDSTSDYKPILVVSYLLFIFGDVLLQL